MNQKARTVPVLLDRSLTRQLVVSYGGSQVPHDPSIDELCVYLRWQAGLSPERDSQRRD
jgi:hypothetical protein